MTDKRNKKVKTLTIEDAMRNENLSEYLNKKQINLQTIQSKIDEHKLIQDDDFKIKRKTRWGNDTQSIQPNTQSIQPNTQSIQSNTQSIQSNTQSVQLNTQIQSVSQIQSINQVQSMSEQKQNQNYQNQIENLQRQSQQQGQLQQKQIYGMGSNSMGLQMKQGNIGMNMNMNINVNSQNVNKVYDDSNGNGFNMYNNIKLQNSNHIYQQNMIPRSQMAPINPYAPQINMMNRPFVPPPPQQQQQQQQVHTVNSNNNGNNQQNDQKNQQLPKDLEDYLTRGFSKCQNNKERKIMEEHLRNIVDNAKQKNQLFTRNWMVFPLPSLPREKNQYFPGIGQLDQQQQREKNEQQLQMQILQQKIEQKQNQQLKQAQQSLEKVKNSKANKLINNSKSQNVIDNLKKKEKSIDSKEEEKKRQRQQRFNMNNNNNTNQMNNSLKSITYGIDGEADFEKLSQKWKITGTCEKIEKEFIRLQHGVPPDPSQVRPEKVLKMALKVFIKKWKERSVDYNYMQEQFRSIRQDLLIQHIRNKFTVKVYETNARIALESHDLNHFNQCQTKLYEFYNENMGGNKHEFIVYRIIYLVLSQSHFQLQRLLCELPAKDVSHKDIKEVLEFKECLLMGDYIRVFEFYKKGLYMTQYLIDIFINRLRIQGLLQLSKGMIDKLPLSYLADVFAFADQDQCQSFLIETGVEINDGLFSTKESFQALSASKWLARKQLQPII